MKQWILLAGLSLSCLPVLAEQVYQWVDENGNLQFSQTPPPVDVNAAQWELNAPTSGTGAAGENAQDAAAPASDKPTDGAALSAQTKQVLEQLTPEQVSAYNCEKAQEKLALLEKGAATPVARMADNKDNNQINLLTPEQRAAEVQAARQQVTEYCQPAQVDKKPQTQAADK